jgi:hypothetical protein
LVDRFGFDGGVHLLQGEYDVSTRRSRAGHSQRVARLEPEDSPSSSSLNLPASPAMSRSTTTTSARASDTPIRASLRSDSALTVNSAFSQRSFETSLQGLLLVQRVICDAETTDPTKLSTLQLLDSRKPTTHPSADQSVPPRLCPARTYSILLLNTDLHVVDSNSRMTRQQFVRNTLEAVRAQADSVETRGSRGSVQTSESWLEDGKAHPSFRTATLGSVRSTTG